MISDILIEIFHKCLFCSGRFQGGRGSAGDQHKRRGRAERGAGARGRQVSRHLHARAAHHARDRGQ